MHDIVIPKLGMSSTDADVVHWHVDVGSVVQPGTPLVDIESEKASLTIEADVAGTVAEIVAASGEVVDVGSVICRISIQG